MDVYSSGSYGGDVNSSSEVDDTDDFYDADPSQPAVMAGAQSQTPAPSTSNKVGTTQASNTPVSSASLTKINADKLLELRAKLLANRQATPVKGAVTAAKNGSAVSVKTEFPSRPQSPARRPTAAANRNKNKQPASNRPTAASILSQSKSIDALLAEGHATVLSQSGDTGQQKTAPTKQQHTTVSTTLKPPAAAVKVVTPKPARVPARSQILSNTAEHIDADNDKSSSTVKSPETPNPQNNKTDNLPLDKANATAPVRELMSLKVKTADPTTNQQVNAIKSAHPSSSGPSHQTSLSLTSKARRKQDDEYFKDVDLWLTITGFHDKTFREQKLKTYKMRAALEEKKRALEREFAELERQEAAAANDPSTKDYMRGASAADMPPPALPAPTSVDDQSASLTKPNPVPTPPASAGFKRPRSPSAPVNNDHREKLSRLDTSGRAVRRDDLFDKPLSASTSRRGSNQRSRNTNDRSDRLERADYRQRAAYDVSPTSHSISVRGQAYRPNDSLFGRRDSWNAPRSPEQWSAQPDAWNSSSFSDVNEAPLGGGFSSNKTATQPRFFIIKSWNMQNVIEAQRDGVWATQEKNTNLFTDAYHTCRTVVLLFSVNKSMAFQGAAVMTSPPSPTVPHPAFCKKLKWPTSSPFRIHWICTTPVHFKFVGHLRNTLNLNEDGEPHAVLVGKDGQEVNTSAGEGVVEILRQRDEDAKTEDDRP